MASNFFLLVKRPESDKRIIKQRVWAAGVEEKVVRSSNSFSFLSVTNICSQHTLARKTTTSTCYCWKTLLKLAKHVEIIFNCQSFCSIFQVRRKRQGSGEKERKEQETNSLIKWRSFLPFIISLVLTSIPYVVRCYAVWNKKYPEESISDHFIWHVFSAHFGRGKEHVFFP